ncbi:MAG: hypothetical protein WCT14_05920 [Treponemataceae bacterium]
MLTEFHNLSQNDAGFRRLFTDDYFDLYLWYESRDGDLSGFQLCYSKADDPHSFTWMQSGFRCHARIDEGEDRVGGYKGTPILVSDGVFEKTPLLRRFTKAAESIDRGIRDLVVGAVQEYR